MTKQNRAVCLGLAVLAILAHGRGVFNGFVNYDDDTFITDNPHVVQGLPGRTFVWAFELHGPGWHPLAWLAHLVEVSLIGVAHPGGFHAFNIAFHAANTVLWFLLLKRMTARFYCALVAALIFAVHPMHVESVGWVVEARDVMFMFFALLTCHAYLFYVRRPTIRGFAVVVLGFALSLLSKPMIVTLPCVLFLLDFWPLRRIQGWSAIGPESSVDASDQPSAAPVAVPVSPGQAILEKAALFPLVAISIWFSAICQYRAGAVVELSDITFPQRIANSIVAYAWYLKRFFWPVDLTIFYPHPGVWPTATLVVSGCVLLALTAGAIVLRRSHPYFIIGWLWFLGTALPIIGLTQIGKQAYADRYSYMPYLGLNIAVVFGGAWIIERLRLSPKWVAPPIAAAIGMGLPVQDPVGSAVTLLGAGAAESASSWYQSRSPSPMGTR